MSDKTKAALQGRQCQNAYQIHSQLITRIDHVKRCEIVGGGNNSTVTGFPVSLRLAGGCFSYISGNSTSPKFLGGVFPVVCNAGILTAPLAQFVKASRRLNQRRNSALGDMENYHLQNILHLLTQIFGAVGSITHSKPVQPFGSMPLEISSRRANSFNQLARLVPSRSASISNWDFKSGLIRILNCGDCPSPLGLLSRLIVDKWSPIELVLLLIGGHLITAEPTKTTPQFGTGNTVLGLTTNANETSEAAMNNHITPLNGRNSLTLNKFTWRFLALNRHDKKAKPCRLSVEATTEHEARRILAPHFILSFAARLPVQEVRYV